MSAPQLPAGLPPLPEGAVYDGMGDERNTTAGDYWCCLAGDRFGWVWGQYKKDAPRAHYARKASPRPDSEAVALVRKLRDAAKDLAWTCDQLAQLGYVHVDTLKPISWSEDGALFKTKNAITEAAAFLAKEETKS